MKKLFISAGIILIITFCPDTFSNPWEVSITNTLCSTCTTTVKVYPTSMVFNNDWYPNRWNPERNYNLYLVQTRQGPPNQIDFINGRNSLQEYFFLPGGNNQIVFDFDGAGGLSNPYNSGVLGYGRYRFDIWYYVFDPEVNAPPDYSFTLEYDDDYGENSYASDVFFKITDDPPKVKYHWGNMGSFVDMPYDNKIECWHQVVPYWRDKVYGNFLYYGGSQIANPYNIFPQDCRKDCNPGGLIANQNHNFQDNSIGRLTQNLTIVKNDESGPVIINTPTTAPYIANNPPPIVVEGDPDIHAGATLTLAAGQSYLERKLNFNQYTGYNFGTDFLVGQYATFKLADAIRQNERAHVYFNNYCNSEFEPHGKLILGTFSQIDVYGNSNMLWDLYSEIYINSTSHLIFHNNSILKNCGAIRTGARNNISFNDQSIYIFGVNCPIPQQNEEPPKVDSAGQYILYDNSQIQLGENYKIVFDGPESFLELHSGSSIQFGSGSSIEFINGAYIVADGCTFTGNNWNGLKFTNIGSGSSITNCTFTGTTDCIDITNDAEHIGNSITLTGNTFNDGKVAINNTVNLNVQGNTFNCYNLQGNLLEVTNNLGSLPAGYSLNINNNIFEGGTGAQIMLNCYGSNVMPFFTTYNQFTSSASGTCYGLMGYNISGDFKYNTFQNDNYINSIQLIGSTQNAYGNVFKSLSGNTLNIQQGSTGQLAPVERIDATYLWLGGFNNLYQDYSGTRKTFACSYFDEGSSLYTDLGENCLNIVSGTNNYHIMGNLPQPCDDNPTYNTTQNWWNLSPPRYSIYCGSNPATVNYLAVLTSCPTPGSLSIGSYVIIDKGNGIYDSIPVTGTIGGGGEASNMKPPTGGEDKSLYGLINQNMLDKNYSTAINNSKSLINLYDTSKYILASLDLLYMAYQHTDTTHNANTTFALFSDLKSYLNQKMTDYQDRQSFVEKAYNYYLMCLVKQKLYSEAIAGYENIMNNDPDPLRRLTASWDRAAVVLLMNGGGGSLPSPSGRDRAPEALRVGSFMNKDPHKLAKDMFSSKREESSDNDASAIKSQKLSKEDKSQLNERAVKFNPSNNKEFKEKISSDLNLLMNIKSKQTGKKIVGNDNIPKSFKLYQNYPNPFNPKTIIKFDLPKDGIVEIKVYDLLGKVVASINEFKRAGTYEFDFNGSNFASGLYFYRMESGTFIETKKMVLIK